MKKQNKSYEGRLLSPNFWTRAWAVWWHNFVINAVILAGLLFLVLLFG